MKLGDDLMKVPKLEVTGSNWVIYKMRFSWSIDARGLLEHIDGSAWEPTKPPITKKAAEDGSGAKKDVTEKLTEAEEKKLEEWKEKLRVWKQGEAVVKQQIAATIPDSLFMKIQGQGSAFLIWAALTNDFQNKSRMVSVDLRRRLQLQRCAEKGDIRSHFAILRTMREDLSSMGQSPTDDDFYAIVIGSLPSGYDPFISALNAASSVLGTFLTPDDLMTTISDEYDRRNLGRTSKKEENVAFHAGESSRKGKSALKCFNCAKKGHKKADCWAEGGGKAGQGPKGKGKDEGKGDGKGKEDKGKGKESAAVAKEDAAWMAMSDVSESDNSDTSSLTSDLSTCPTLDELLDGIMEIDDDVDSCPDLEQIYSDDEEGLEAEEMLEDWEDWGEDEESIPTVNRDSGEAAYTSTFDLGMLSQDGLGSKLIDIELFDSGASRHMSGHRRRFVNFIEIEARPITAADKRSFDAIGKGDMYIDVPKGNGTSRILLRDVLYTPKMGVTLISIGKITDSGSSVLFHGNTC